MFTKGGVNMTSSNYLTLFQQIFAPFRNLIAKTCISLFFFALNSGLAQLLIKTSESETKKSNPIQREFDSNVRIATFEPFLAPSSPRQNTNFLKQSALLLSSASPFLCLVLLSFAEPLKC
jgi:hypothetical protein